MKKLGERGGGRSLENQWYLKNKTFESGPNFLINLV